MATTRVDVYRKGPETQARYDTFEIEVRPAETVLDVLHKILEERDPTLAFRRSCRSAICGSCAMHINGRSRLACNTQALDLAKRDGRILIEPMRNLPVVRDLAVDMRGFWHSVRRINPSLVEIPAQVPEKAYTYPNEAYEGLKIVSDCIFCGACLSECTVREVNSKYIGPAALAKAFRFVGDPRDGATHQRLAAYSEPDGIWDCDSCLYCNEVCPKGVKPFDAIIRMREAAIERGLVDNIGARHAIAFYDTVMKAGRLNEATTAIRSLGLAGFLRPGSGNVSIAIKSGLRGKSPELRKKPLEGMEDVRTLVQLVRKGKGNR